MNSENHTKAAVLLALRAWRESNFATDLGVALKGTGWEDLVPELYAVLKGSTKADGSPTIDALKLMIVEQMPLDTVIFDDQGKYIYVNPSAVKRDDVRQWMIGKTFSEYAQFRGIDPEVGKEVDQAIATAIRERRQVELRQKVQQTSEGPRTFVRLIRPVTNESGGISFVVGFGLDITNVVENETRLEAQNHELEKAKAELDQFIYKSSHEMRAPLTTAEGLLDLLEEENDSLEKKQYVLMCKASLAKLDTYIREIVDFSKNSKDELNICSIDVERILRNVWNSLGRMPGFKDMELSLDVAAMAEPLRLDAERTRMVLEALLSNAIRFRDKGKLKNLVWVKVCKTESGQCIEVGDNGLGISKAYETKIYDMFFRGSQVNSGSGLGLYLLREAVDKMGGKIEMQTKEGQGTVFKLIFPAA